MKKIDLAKVLPSAGRDTDRRLGFFALLTLGVVELLVTGAMSSAEAVRLFFHADNCLYVRNKLRDKVADKIMSHGVQLIDLFEVLPSKEAQQQFQRELGSIRGLCLRLLNQHELAA